MDYDIFDFDNYFFIGIGGVSMMALTQILLKLGKKVSGSDVSDSTFGFLQSLGVKTYLGHDASHIEGQDVVVYNKAIPQDNVELLAACKRNIPCIDRAELLGYISNLHKNTIAVSGTHGKTTTTAMIAMILFEDNRHPSVHIGGRWSEIGGYGRLGLPEYFVTEACEYKESFLCLSPDMTVVTNIESEHLDYYKTRTNLNNAFVKLARQTKRAVVCPVELKALLGEKSITFGINEGDYQAKNISKKQGCYSFALYVRGMYKCRISLSVPGRYNILNALAASAVCIEEGISVKSVVRGLKKFNNVDRRFEVLYSGDDLTVIQDYAHHPTEIHNCLSTCKEIYGDVVCVFQPHTYSRTKYLLEEFKTCFDGAKKLYLLPTYASRESYDEEGSIQTLKKAICENIDVHICNELPKNIANSGCIAFVGAGDIEKLAREYVKSINKNKKYEKSLDYLEQV